MYFVCCLFFFNFHWIFATFYCTWLFSLWCNRQSLIAVTKSHRKQQMKIYKKKMMKKLKKKSCICCWIYISFCVKLPLVIWRWKDSVHNVYSYSPPSCHSHRIAGFTWRGDEMNFVEIYCFDRWKRNTHSQN